MRRRLILAAACALPALARAQRAPRLWRIGVLNGGSRPPTGLPATLAAFLRGMRDLDYIEGQTLELDIRFADWRLDRLPGLAEDLVARRPDLLFAAATPAAIALKRATSTLPIVAANMGDPVSDGLVASLSAPGGNLTGNSFVGPELVRKRFTLMQEVLPKATRIAGLWHPGAYGERTMQGFLQESEASARALGLDLTLVRAESPAALEPAFAQIAAGGAEALFVLPSGMLYAEARRIAGLAAQQRLPGMYQAREFVEAGGLIAYGANIPDMFRRAARYADRILKGARPADLPVEQPTRFELALNLGTARALGLTIPPTILAGADEVLE